MPVLDRPRAAAAWGAEALRGEKPEQGAGGMRYTVVLRGARGSSGPRPQALIKVEKRGAVPRPQNLRMGEGGPRWEARHSCGLPLSLCGAHDPRRATLVTSPVAAHTLTSSVGGGGAKGPSNMVNQGPSNMVP